MNRRKIIMGIASVLAFIFVVGIIFHLKVPLIKASNAELYRNQISSNAPLTITFNQLMNRGSVEASFKIEPAISGDFSWLVNRLTFKPQERFTVGETYTVTVAKDAKNLLGKSLAEDYVLHFLVVDPPKVALAVPNNETITYTKVTVMFDRPLIEFTTLDESNKKDFPLQLTPELDGKFKWIGTSAFQYLPATRFAYATEYKGTIPAGTQTLDGGVLEKEYSFSFKTPRLKFDQDEGQKQGTILARDPFRLRFSHDANLESLGEHTKVTHSGDAIALKIAYGKKIETHYDSNGKALDKEVEDKTLVEITPAKKDWGYDEKYSIDITQGVMGLEGNIASESTLSKSFSTGTFLTSSSPEKNQIATSPSGPIELRFDQDVDRGSIASHFTLQPAVELSFSYGEKCDPKWEPKESPEEICAKIDDHTVVLATPRQSLGNLKKYVAKLGKEARAANGNTYLKDDITWDFTTADTFKILRVDFGVAAQKYRQVCLYTTTEANLTDFSKNIVFSPAIHGKPYFSNDSFGGDDYLAKNSVKYNDRRPCKPQSKDEHFGIQGYVLMDPATPYTIKVTTAAQDVFKQHLSTEFTTRLTTGALLDTDTHLNLVQPNFYAVTTLNQHATTVFTAQNLNEFDIDICRVSAEKYLDVDTQWARGQEKNDQSLSYLDYGWKAFEPSTENCEVYKRIQKKLPHIFWEKQYVEINVAEELGNKPTAGYYYVRASSPRVYQMQGYYNAGGPQKVLTRPDQLLGFTNLHVTIKKSRDTALFWATDMTTGQPVSGVNLTLYSQKGAALEGSSTTNKDGIAQRALHGLDFNYVIAAKNGEHLVVGTDWNDGIAHWDYNMNYSEAHALTQGYIYTDRPLYQPTHEVFFKGIIRDDEDAQLKLPSAKKITVIIDNSRGTNVSRKEYDITPQGTFGGSIKLDEKAELGQYMISTCTAYSSTDSTWCKDGYFQQFFSVEEYRKPEYKLDATFSKESYVDKEKMQVSLDGKYFFGAPVTNSKVTWSIRAQNYYFDEYTDEWFSFTNYETYAKCYFGCPFYDQYLANGEGQLNEKGHYTFEHPIDLSTKDEQGKPKAPDASRIYTVDATVQDKNNQSVSVSQSVLVHRGEFYVGVKNEEYIVAAGGKMPIKVITVDPKGTPTGGKNVELELLKVNWKYVKKKNVDGGFYWDNEQEFKKVDSEGVTTGDDGMARYSFKVKDGGEYFVRATAKDTKGNSFGSSIDFYATTNEVVNWKHDNNNRMELKLDKMTYNVGDTAKVLVKSPYTKVKALVTTERGDITSPRVVDITSNAHVIEVPITDKMLPNVYLSVLEAKGGNSTDDLPDFKLGYANIVVDTQKKALNIEIKPDKERYQPGETVALTVTTTDASGKPVAANLSMAVVDESLLALKGNEKRNLLGLFYNRRDIGVITADTMTNFLERVNISDLKGSKGGSGKGAVQTAVVRGKFEDTAFWRQELSTNSAGTLTTSFKLPDNLTTWNIEVIGATLASQFGSINKAITTQKSVMVRPVLPRFALFQDTIDLGGIIHNFTGHTARFNVSISAENLTIADNPTKEITIPKDGSQKVLWSTVAMKVPEGTRAKVTLSAKIADAGAVGEDAVVQEFPLNSYSTPESVALSGSTSDLSYTEKIVLPTTIDPTLGELKITTGATLATYISDSLNYLMQFPYGCTEQLVSSLVPNLILKNATSLANLRDKIKLIPLVDGKGKVIPFDTMVQTTLQRLYSYQRSDGGFGYFAESRQSIPSVTAYTIYAFDQIKKAGFSVDSGVQNRAVTFVTNYMKGNLDLKNSFTGKLNEKTPTWANNRAYMLFVLAESGRGDTGLSNSLFDDRALLSNGGKAYVAMALSKAGQNDKVQMVIQELENSARIDARGTYIRSGESSSWDMMTATKTSALTVQLLNRVKPDHVLLPKLVNWLIKVRKNGRWETTQDTVTALTAFTEYLDKNKETEATYKAKISLGGVSVKEYSVDGATILDQQEVTKAISELTLGGDGTKVVFSKEGTGRLYYDMVLRYFLPIEKIAPRDEGFIVERNYYRLDDKKMERPITQAKAGETLKGHITVVVPQDRHAVALENFLPAGFELVNFEFKTADQRLLLNENFEQQRHCEEFDYDCWNTRGPVPAYGDYGASGYYYGFDVWTHKELRDDRLFLFADHLAPGVYDYEYYVQVTSEGKFHHPPAVVSEMYFPENFGRTKGEWVEVKE